MVRGSRSAAAAVLLLASCKAAPRELSPPSDSGDMVDEARRPATRPPGWDAGHGLVGDFCESAYLADSERERATCSPADFARGQSLGRVASGLCSRDLAEALAGARATFDRAAASGCIEMLREKALEPGRKGDTLFGHYPCDRVVVGTVERGGACRFSVECQDGLACVSASTGTGICVPPPAAGRPCSRQAVGATLGEAVAALHHPACTTGAWCDGRSCQARRKAGAPCSKSEACAEGLACVLGTCGTAHGPSEPCRTSSDCEAGLWCALPAAPNSDGRCRAKLDAGSPCSFADSCKGRCAFEADAGPVRRGECMAVCGSG